MYLGYLANEKRENQSIKSAENQSKSRIGAMCQMASVHSYHSWLRVVDIKFCEKIGKFKGNDRIPTLPAFLRRGE